MSTHSAKRPLSPHLQIYSWGLHMAMSIVHRMTGVAAGAGFLALVWWLLAVAAGPEEYEFFRQAAVHPIGRVVMTGFVFSLVYHLLNGIRHLIWDTGQMLEIGQVRWSGVVVLLLSVASTLAIFTAVYHLAGRLG